MSQGEKTAGKVVELKRSPCLLVPALERVDVPCLPTTGGRLRQMKAIFQEMGSLNSNMGGGKEEMVVGLFETGSE